MSPRFRLDRSYRRHDSVVIGGSPLRLFRLSAAGRRVVEAIEKAEPLPAGHGRLTDRLADAGAIHPQPTESAYAASDVTIVVPAYNAEPRFTATEHNTIVVDDGSDPPLPERLGRRLIRLAVNSGPGAARNAGLAAAQTPLVAFVDTDVDAGSDWLGPLLVHFSDPRVALVAPRVGCARGDSAIAGYEAFRSPLDLGADAARISAGSRVSYVPGAAIVARTDVLRSIGGFDESMRSGEDVDLVWRLVEGGHRCRYEPAVTVFHQPRPTLRAWFQQRVTYGRSAAALDRKHSGAVAPLRLSGWSALVWGLVALRRPWSAAAVAAGTTIALRRKLVDLPAMESVRLAGLGHLYAGRQVANALIRAWWPAAVLAAIVFKRLRPAVIAAATAPPLIDWWQRRGPLDPARYVLFRVADDVAYGTGLWLGAIEIRRYGALAPKFTNWPGRASD
ncbi:MAG TPA: mycofactocin biosynthesis glycosyltransferase MftF [Ilumatobacteraceae bacterium]|nr:mycofactocin biosynthesis glycosyltransferase MftF [Ilumatobacteraceae bacterium]